MFKRLQHIQMFVFDVRGQHVLVFSRVSAVTALKLRFHAANVLHVSAQIVGARKTVATFRAHSLFYPRFLRFDCH